MWLEGLDDPKLTRLSLAERGAWWGLLMLAGKCSSGGKIVSGDVGLDMDEIADALHIKTDDRQALEAMLAKMEKRGSLTWNDDVLIVVHYEERQKIPPSARPEAVAKRVRDYRDRRKEHIPTEEEKLESEYQNKLAVAKLEKKGELGRPLTDDEVKELTDKIRREVYGE